MTLPPPPPDAWGNSPGQPYAGDEDDEPRRPFGRGYTPAGWRSTSREDFYGERLATRGQQTAAGLIDGAIIWAWPWWYGYVAYKSSFYGYYGPKGPWEWVGVLEWRLSLVLALLNCCLLVGATGATVGQWIAGLRAVRVWFVPGPATADGGWYFCNPPGFGSGLRFAFFYPVIDLLPLGYGLTTIYKSNLRQSIGARRGGFVVVSRAWLFKFRNAADLGHAAKQVAPFDAVFSQGGR